MATISAALAIALEHQQAGRLEIAADICRRILAVEPNQPDALHRLGIIAQQNGQLEAAVEYVAAAIRQRGSDALFHKNLGTLFKMQGRLDEAIAAYRQALRLKPDFAEAYVSLGAALKNQGRLDEALASYQRAVLQRPDYAEAHYNVGNAWRDRGGLDEAAAAYRRALHYRPDYAPAHHNLGVVLRDQGRLDEAVAAYQHALHYDPDCSETYVNLGIALRELDRLDEALAEFQTSLRRKPDYAPAHSNLLYTHCFHPDSNAQRIYEAHCRWNAEHAEPLSRSLPPHTNDRTPDRRLRIGYVSPDYRWHPVGRFVLPLLESHDHAQFEIFAYSSVRVPDGITERCRAQVDVWREVTGFQDEHLVDTIRRDQIDILVDLTMHTADNRILVFARKPAPVQVTYLAYCGTTGLRTVEFFAERGVASERVTFVGGLPSQQYFELYHRIDVALDPFPYGGGTTTCDALWMGVPVVSLAGQTAVGRGGLSILSNVGLANLVAWDDAQYVRIAADLAKDLPRLAELRAALRARMQTSPLMDAPRFARNVEAAYRWMWRRWCAG